MDYEGAVDVIDKKIRNLKNKVQILEVHGPKLLMKLNYKGPLQKIFKDIIKA